MKLRFNVAKLIDSSNSIKVSCRSASSNKNDSIIWKLLIIIQNNCGVEAPPSPPLDACPAAAVEEIAFGESTILEVAVDTILTDDTLAAVAIVAVATSEASISEVSNSVGSRSLGCGELLSILHVFPISLYLSLHLVHSVLLGPYHISQ